jgi:hypothetical protein
VRQRGKILEVHLDGPPETIGYRHARLLYPQMVENEGVLLDLFRSTVSSTVARQVLLDLAQLRFRTVDRGMSADRLREIAGGALGFQPDPYASVFATYQRFVYLNALYDMSLSFEHSPLIGCTTMVLSGAATRDGKTLLARAFDFEAHDIFDTRKAIFFVREDGRLPFASVAWPGLVGVVSGMNAEGVAVVVHGGRAGEVETAGEPVVHSLRRVLSTAKSTDEALAALRERSAMVSHIVVVTDAHGHSVVVERVPNKPNYTYRLGQRDAVTNHYIGPAADDAKNERVRQSTSTLARKQRADQLVRTTENGGTEQGAVTMLRDRHGLNGARLELGDRRAIDALIATHGVVMNTTDKTIWVSESPHLLGRFLAFDLTRLLAADYDDRRDLAELRAIPADALLTSGEYAKYERSRAQAGR